MDRIRHAKYLVVVSGPSGCGKDSVIQELIRIRPDITLAVSATSRPKREYEIDGVHYYFKTREAFMKAVEADAMLEYTEYAGNFYGTPIAEIEEKLARRETVVLVIEVKGAKRVKEMFPDSLLVFIIPPSLEELERRLELRNTETKIERARRIEIAQTELRHMADYDEVLMNDDLKDTARKLEITINDWQRNH